MEIEIELKFIFNEDFADNLYQTLNKWHCISSKNQFLHNVYFDTAERNLRQLDMGLRVRTIDEKSVQTIKTAGKVIGGLHQRPEYNEPIEGSRPELARFNSKIWPEDSDIQALENALIPIFSTDFNRQSWLIEIEEDTLVEVAYDVGFIETNQGKVPLCEVELELVKGDEKQLFTLGKQIAQIPDVRLGNVSKAQRGYMLADNATFPIKKLVHSPIDEKLSIKQALLVNLQHGLKQLQYHENCYIENKTRETLQEFLQGIKFLHQNIILFKSELENFNKAPWIEDLHWLARSFSWLDEYFTHARLLEDKGFYLRKSPKSKLLKATIKHQKQLLPNDDAIITILKSSRYCQFVLTFTQWLIQLEKSTFSGDKSNNIKAFSVNQLDKTWGQVSLALKNNDALTAEQFLSFQGLIESSLLTGLSLGNVFEKQKSDAFRALWLDIKQGLDEFSMINIISEIAQDETDSVLRQDYLKWIKRKEESLLSALHQSKQQALRKTLYWQEEQN
ncbi:CYTH domain-containing protein [Psychromonas sp. KJ10-10]|uniref:CYTH and CHAD domain-containing protein n=1 Tax=Psychromonas sp. KJ10-10 TaxID=3391823 RepID=UPI0039B54805